MKVLVVLVALSVASGAQAQGVYCGRRLAMVLAQLCSSDEDKRAGWASWGPFAHEQSAPRHEWPAWLALPQPWLQPARAHSLGRPKRQVVMECCMKPCSEDELLTYC